MTRREWKVRVVGLVSRLRQDRARVSVPRGEYAMREIAFGSYELSGDGKPTFKLPLKDVAYYLNEKHLRIVGRWPLA